MNTPSGDPWGYIDPHGLRELWFHTGTACNLRCSFCLEGSQPGDTRLAIMKYDDVVPFVDEAVALGVQQFSFTGGEPFLARDLIRILAYVCERRPAMVLTNGTDPLLRRFAQLEPLRRAPNPVRFRISIDHPDAAQHDAERGAGNFAKAFQALSRLHDAGFGVSVARLMAPDEDRDAVDAAYRALFRAHALPESLTIVPFPDFAAPGSHPDVPYVTEHCMTTYHSASTRREFMCAFSKMVVKQNGRMRVYACTLVDDDASYDLGDTLTDAMAHRIRMRHHRCYSCFALGASCSEA